MDMTSDEDAKSAVMSLWCTQVDIHEMNNNIQMSDGKEVDIVNC